MANSIGNVPLNTVPDIPDARDYFYQPPLITLRHAVDPPATLRILDQGDEGACTGFGLAAVINKLNHDRGSDITVSPRMLYEMAKRYDSWPGEDYAGSSCRGAIKGWHSMGVCEDRLWKFQAGDKDRHLSIERAKNARSNTIGAYYRIRPNIVHMHGALNETSAIYVSANIHDGWSEKSVKRGVIRPRKKTIGAHAFAVVGYDETGFWIQNSWGDSWGKNGLAHWSYEDWQDNVLDAWVVRLALPTPQLWNREFKNKSQDKTTLFGSNGPRRSRIAGHFVHIDDGLFDNGGKYWSSLEDVRCTSSLVAKSDKYDHLLFYAHGGLNSVDDSARRIAALKDLFKANRIYPYHFMYDTGILEEIKDLVLGKKSRAEGMVGGVGDWLDQVVEHVTRRPGRALWREMKSDAEVSFTRSSRAGCRTLQSFLDALQAPSAKPKKIHLAGHSTGAILIAHLLRALEKMKTKIRISSVSLLAPAASVALFESHYRPLLGGRRGKFGIDQLNIYNLSDKLEKNDNVALVYRKSLLYLVSNAFEEEKGEPILGMQKFAEDIDRHRKMEFITCPDRSRSMSKSHGGFDNDTKTMNDLVKTILGQAPKRKFEDSDLDY